MAPDGPEGQPPFKPSDDLLALGRQAAAQKPDKHPAMVAIEEAHAGLRMALARHADQVRRFEAAYVELLKTIADEEGGS